MDRSPQTSCSRNPTNTVGASVYRQLQVIAALLEREVERRRAHPVKAILSIFEPLIVIFVLTLFWYTLNLHATVPLGRSVLVFHSVSILPFYFFIYISRKNMSGGAVSHLRRFPVEVRLDHIFTGIIVRFFDYTILCVVFLLALNAYGIEEAIPAKAAPLAEAVIAVIMLAFGWGIFSDLMGRLSEFFTYVNIALTRGLLLFSGLWFIPDTLSPATRYVLSFNPMLHVIDLCRMAFYPNYRPLLFDGGYLFGWALFMVCLGLALERLSRRLEAKPKKRRQ